MINSIETYRHFVCLIESNRAHIFAIIVLMLCGQNSIYTMKTAVVNTPKVIIIKEYTQPLLAAAIKNDIATIEALLKEGMNVNVTEGEDSCTALHIAAMNGNEELFTFLLEKGGNVNAVTSSGETILHSACMGYSPNPKIVAALLANKLDIGARSKEGRTPLHGAIRAGNVEIIKLLISHGAYKYATAFTDADVDKITPLHEAARKGNKEVVEILIGCGAAVKDSAITARDKDGKTPLHWAVQNNHLEVVKLLLLAKASTSAENQNGDTPVHMAAQLNRVEILTEFLENEAHLIKLANSKGELPLHHAVSKVVVCLLLKHDAELLNTTDNNGRTALHSAARLGNAEAGEMLIAQGADIIIADKNGHTPLHLAALNPASTKLVGILLQKST